MRLHHEPRDITVHAAGQHTAPLATAARLRPCLLQGMWAEKELPRMAGPEIAEFEAVLDQENPDMFKWLTGQVGAVVRGLLSYVLCSLLSYSAYGTVGCTPSSMMGTAWNASSNRLPVCDVLRSLQEAVPVELQSNSVFQRLRQHVKTMTDEHHNVPAPAGSEQQKEWVRGWTDSGAELAGGESAAGKSS